MTLGGATGPPKCHALARCECHDAWRMLIRTILGAYADTDHACSCSCCVYGVDMEAASSRYCYTWPTFRLGDDDDHKDLVDPRAQQEVLQYPGVSMHHS